MTRATTLALIIATVLAATLSASAIWAMLRAGISEKILDTPNDRSLHVNPTPRIGGICLVLAVLATMLFEGMGSYWPVLAATFGLALISFGDDIWTLPASLRFGTHWTAAAVVVFCYPSGPVWLLPFVAVYLVWVTNLYNFMDGMDGFSGGMAVIGFGTFAVASMLATPNSMLAIVSISVVGASLGFLAFNFPPARVFMGDGGAVPIGFLAGALGYFGYREGIWPWWFGPFVFSPFIVDATVTLLRRLFAREKVWQPHRSHYYQRMAQSGLGHRQTTLRWYALMLAVAATALLTQNRSPGVVAAVAAAWIVIYASLMVWIDRHWPRSRVKVPQSI